LGYKYILYDGIESHDVIMTSPIDMLEAISCMVAIGHETLNRLVFALKLQADTQTRRLTIKVA